LLLGFRQPQGGQVRMNGMPLGALPLEEWRAGIACVPQQPYLFNDTLGKNLNLGRPDATPEQVADAARLAGLEEFIHSLPAGYQTRIGESGVRLSGGQAQRLALARAFLMDARLVLLDEPAAGLDAELEEWLAEAIQRLCQGRTVLSITHRLGTVRRSNQVVVIANGRVVEMGPPAALQAQSGAYARIVKAYAGT